MQEKREGRERGKLYCVGVIRLVLLINSAAVAASTEATLIGSTPTETTVTGAMVTGSTPTETTVTGSTLTKTTVTGAMVTGSIPTGATSTIIEDENNEELPANDGIQP